MKSFIIFKWFLNKKIMLKGDFITPFLSNNFAGLTNPTTSRFLDLDSLDLRIQKVA